MVLFIILIALGLIVILLGINIMRGSVYLIHEYHIQQVTEADKAAFGKRMGLGTLFCGSGIGLFGVLAVLAEVTSQPFWMTTGVCSCVVSLVAGIGIMIRTTRKHNGSIF